MNFPKAISQKLNSLESLLQKKSKEGSQKQ